MSAEYHQALEEAGHVLKRHENGEIDVFVLEYEYHNGPGCILCNESWCHHCQPEITPCPKMKREPDAYGF